jgi:hypothetical protein
MVSARFLSAKLQVFGFGPNGKAAPVQTTAFIICSALSSSPI